MANSLNIPLHNRVVILSKKYYAGTEEERRFLCTNGFGCIPHADGKKIFGIFLINGDRAVIYGYEVEKLASDQSRDTDKVKTQCETG